MFYRVKLKKGDDHGRGLILNWFEINCLEQPVSERFDTNCQNNCKFFVISEILEAKCQSLLLAPH